MISFIIVIVFNLYWLSGNPDTYFCSLFFLDDEGSKVPGLLFWFFWIIGFTCLILYLFGVMTF